MSKLKIGFLSPQLDLRGSCIALFDYIKYNKLILGNESVLILPEKSKSINDIRVFNKFNTETNIIYYHEIDICNNEYNLELTEIGIDPISNNRKLVLCDLDDKLISNKVDLLYTIRHGEKKNSLVSKKIPTVVHCVFDMSYPHGVIYAAVSKNITIKYGSMYSYVPHVVNVEKTDNNMRNKLNIPKDKLVFGYHGGSDAFNIPFVIELVKEIVKEYDNIYFIFMNIPMFIIHKQIIFIEGTCDLIKKAEFINTMDGFLHAQIYGETFGLSIAEASICNKPIICYDGPVWNDQHRKILRDRALYYSNKETLRDILINFNEYRKKLPQDLNFYREYSPENVMLKFKQVFIDPIFV